VGVDPDPFCVPGSAFGAIPIVVLGGDFMQLPPFETRGVRTSLMKEPSVRSDLKDNNSFARQGYRLFWNCITDVVMLYKTFRFVDKSVKPQKPCKILPRLFKYMRHPYDEHGNSVPLPDDHWESLQNMQVRGLNDPRLATERLQEGFQMGIFWESSCNIELCVMRRRRSRC